MEAPPQFATPGPDNLSALLNDFKTYLDTILQPKAPVLVPSAYKLKLPGYKLRDYKL